MLAKNTGELYYRSLAENWTSNLAYLGDLVTLSGHTRSLCACFWNEKTLSRIFRKARLKFDLSAGFGGPPTLKGAASFSPHPPLPKNLLFVFGLTRSGEIFTVNRYAAYAHFLLFHLSIKFDKFRLFRPTAITFLNSFPCFRRLCETCFASIEVRAESRIAWKTTDRQNFEGGWFGPFCSIFITCLDIV